MVAVKVDISNRAVGRIILIIIYFLWNSELDAKR